MGVRAEARAVTSFRSQGTLNLRSLDWEATCEYTWNY
jgi:hypothetical protein